MAALTAALISSIVTFLYPLELSAATSGALQQPETKVAGTITIRNGEAMNVTTADGKTVEVVLNPDTKIEKPKGITGFRNKQLDVTALAPGLSVVVQGAQYENDQLVAKTITISPHSLQSSTVASAAGVAGAQDKSLADYSMKTSYDAHFQPGSALLSPDDKTGLMDFANSATGLHTYIIEVKGFADVPGSNAYDQQLSRDRAEAVIDYLEKTGSVPVAHIIAPGVLGPQTPSPANEPAAGNPQNRRVQVELLLPKNAGNH